MRNIKSLTFSIAVLVHSSGVLAQSGKLEEVIVTATKRAANLQDIPVTVNAISETAIQDAGVSDVGDVAALVPSLTVSTNISPFASGIRIRGFGTSQNDPALEASVAFILDGVYMGRSGLGMSDLSDIERIEVLQGPQGTLYGKNSNAGVISVVTKSPNMEEFEGFVEASLGNYSLQRYLGSISGPATDSVAYRLSGSWHEHDGWLENNSGDDLNAVQDWNARGKLLWTPSESLNIELSASHVERDTSCCGADATQTTAVLDELQAQGRPVPINNAFDHKNNVDIESKFDLTADAVNLKLDYDLESVTITSLTAWGDYDYETSLDADRSDLSLLWVEDDQYTGELRSQEFRLTSELDGPLQYMAGLFYSLEEITRGGSDSGAIILGDDIVSVGGAATGFGANIALGVQPGDTVTFDSKWESETLAVFGQSTYNLNEDWAVTLGARYTYETKDAHLNTQPFSTAPLFGTGQTLVEQAYAAVNDSFNRDSKNFTGLANLTYFLGPDSMVFASVSTGSKSGGFNGVAGENAAREFDDEDSTNYEVGIKSQLFDNRLQLNITTFYTEFTDLQFLAQQTSGVGFFVSNAAEGSSTGIDMNFSAAPWPFMTVSGGVQYLDAKYTDGKLDEAGLDVAFAANWSGNLSATLFLPLASGTIYLRGDYSFIGDHYTNPNYQDPKTEQDKELANFRLGWRNTNWDAALWVKNATDESYAAATAEPLAFSGTEAYFLEAPRTYGVTVRHHFD